MSKRLISEAGATLVKSVSRFWSPLDPIQKYSVELHQQVFFPGDTVTGVLHLTTKEPAECRAVHIELIGRSSGRHKKLVQDDGIAHKVEKAIDMQGHTHRYYARERKSVWGKVMRTPTINGGGVNPVFGPPWAPLEGVLLVSVPADGSGRVILRVMDEDFGPEMADDFLGEALLDPTDLVRYCETVNRDYAIPLRKNGKGGYGEAMLRACWADQLQSFQPDLATYQHLSKPGERLLYLEVKGAQGLKDSDLFSANDIYCQVYSPPDGVAVTETAAMPPPPSESQTMLPAVQFEIPFRFKLPDRLPPSIETGDRGFVRYSIYSHLDISHQKCPSTRTFFTVLAKNPLEYLAPGVVQPVHGQSVSESQPRCCGLLKPTDKGNIHLQVGTIRRAFAPGEKIPLDIQVVNNNVKPAKLGAAVVRHFTAEGLTGKQVWTKVLCALATADMDVVPPGDKFNAVKDLILPACAPGFTSSSPCWMEDVRFILNYPRGEWFSKAEGMKGHPFRWQDTVEVTVKVEGGPEVCHDFQCNIIAFPPGADLTSPQNSHQGAAGDDKSATDKLRHAIGTPAQPIVLKGMAIAYVPDPQGKVDATDPREDTHSFSTQNLTWSPLCPLSKPEAWPTDGTSQPPPP